MRQTKAQDQARSFSFASEASIDGLDARFIANTACIKGQKPPHVTEASMATMSSSERPKCCPISWISP
jgi:hypothetical protein